MGTRVRAKVTAEVKKVPVKAGSKAPKNVGGFFNFKLLKIRRRRK